MRIRFRIPNTASKACCPGPWGATSNFVYSLFFTFTVNAGLAVMGQNLILNMNDHGFTVVAFNRTTSKVDDFLQNEVIKILLI
jgi:hypothetical protein